jgi:hypothetical protein
MKHQELKKDTWYSLYPYGGVNEACQWWMKENGKQKGQCSMYISWFHFNGERQFQKTEGNLAGYDYREADPREAAWLAEVERRGEYFPIEQFEQVINNYQIY